MEDKIEVKKEIAVLANGCFWCTEAVFVMLKGVYKVAPGYAGGKTENPHYDEVSSGQSGHAECLIVEFDPTVITFEDLLIVFFNTHDPTTLNRQGHDIGTQYRSAIFYNSPQQKETATRIINELNESKTYDKPIVTEVFPLVKFYEAEDYHHNYYENNSNQPYCQIVIAPKIEKMQKRFAQLLKDQK